MSLPKHSLKIVNSEPWYKEGLNFQCTECGKCCTGGPGYVWVTEEEITSIAGLLNLSVELFKRKYVRLREKRFALVEKKSQEKECIFLKDKKCQIYQARPKQCQTFPFWEENLNSEMSWNIAAESCEGINKNAPLISLKEIEEILKRNSNS